jgi:hypothetical protein
MTEYRGAEPLQCGVQYAKGQYAKSVGKRDRISINKLNK